MAKLPRRVPLRPWTRDDIIDALVERCDVSPPGARVLDQHESNMVIDDHASKSLFCECGGILIETDLSRVITGSSSVLCDIAFWTFWDVIIFGGWVFIDVVKFNTIYNHGRMKYIALVPSNYLLHCSCCRLFDVGTDERCDVNSAYSVFSSIIELMESFSSHYYWFNGSARFSWPSNLLSVTHQSRFFEYQFELLFYRIKLREPIKVILCHLLDLNALAVSITSMLPPNFDANDVDDLKSLLLDQLVGVVHFKVHSSSASRLDLFCNIDSL